MAPIANSDGNHNLFNEVSSLLKLIDESASVEYKRSEKWDILKFRIVKTTLAMGNKRDDGIIIIGVAESGSNWEKIGISSEHIETYDTDDMKGHIGSFASSAINLTIVKHSEDGKDYLVIKVDEFAEYPFVCKKNHKEGDINIGDVYIRSKTGKPETRKINDEREMRELLEVAIEKGVARRIEEFKRIKNLIDPDNLKRKYDQELGDL